MAFIGTGLFVFYSLLGMSVISDDHKSTLMIMPILGACLLIICVIAFLIPEERDEEWNKEPSYSDVVAFAIIFAAGIMVIPLMLCILGIPIILYRKISNYKIRRKITS